MTKDPNQILDSPLGETPITATSHDRLRWKILAVSLCAYLLLGICFQWSIEQLIPTNSTTGTNEDKFSVVVTTTYLVILYGWSAEHYLNDLNWKHYAFLFVFTMGTVFSFSNFHTLSLVLYLKKCAPVFVPLFFWLLPVCFVFELYIWRIKYKTQHNNDSNAT